MCACNAQNRCNATWGFFVCGYFCAPFSPSDTAEERAASTSGATRDREPDAGHHGRSVRQRI
jgi:hypothetical protein